IMTPSFLFDLDGTLVDSVYQHVLAWREALEQAGIELAVWRIHRRIGMSGGLFVNALLRETKRDISAEEADRLRRLHAEAYARKIKEIRPLPGSLELLRYLSTIQGPHGIARGGGRNAPCRRLRRLRRKSHGPVVTRDQVRFANPNPVRFLAAAD